jgi:hypothetical protein
VLLFAAAAVVPLFRQTGTPSWRSIWAEDGTICFQQAYREGAIAVLLRPIAGYLTLPPRLLGGLATLVPLAYLPVFLALAATTVGALLAWFTYSASAGWIASRPVRLALASQVVLMPALGQENTATIVNIIWIFAAVVPWALISLQERPRHVIARSAVAFLAATATALTVFFLPLAIGWTWIRRTRATWIVAGALCAGLALQLAVVAADPAEHAPVASGTYEVPALVDLVALRVFAVFLVGQAGIAAMWIEHGRFLIVAAPIAAAVILAFLFCGADRARRVLATVFIAYAVVAFVVPVMVRGPGFIPIAVGNPSYLFAHLRFSVVPVMMLLSAVAVLIGPADGGAPQRIARIARPLFVAYVTVITLSAFPVKNLRSSSPPWPIALRQAYERDCSQSSPDQRVRVRTNAVRSWPIWLSCRELASATAQPDAQ